MSLVAAYSDSESESDAEEHSNVPCDSNKIIPNVATNVESSAIPPIIEEETSQHIQIEHDDWVKDNVKKKESDNTSLFSVLPQPKIKKCELVEERDDEFIKKTEFNKQVNTPPPVECVETSNEMENPLKRTLLNLPKPSRKMEKRQPVKISIPTLEEIGADSDSDDEETKKDNVKNPSKKKSTLFSLLPKPKCSVTVGNNKNKVFSREANRPLVPHTLTKKKEPPIKSESNKKKNKETKPLVAEFSDSDDDNDDNVSSDNFFSLGNSTSCNRQDVPDIKSSLSSNNATLDVTEDHIDAKHTPVNEKKSVSLINRHTPDTENKNISLINKKLPLDSDNNNGNSFFSNLYKSEPNIKTESVILKTNKNTNSINTESNTVTAPKPNESSNFVTAPYTAPYTDTTKNHISSYNNVTESYSNVTAPYLKESEPCSDATTPYSNVTAPYESVTAPYESVTAPYESVTAPYESVTAPYESVTAPYESVTAPYGSVTAPYESVTAPYGNITAPYGNITAPYGNVTAPYGNVTGSYENITGNRSARQSTANEVSNEGTSGNRAKTYPSSPHFFASAYHKDQTSEQLSETVEETSEVDYYHKPNEDLPIDKDALKALQGRKRRKEDINVIDIRAVDIQANNTDYLKNLTSESPEYQKLKAQKDKDQPTSGQKRKHQITYLAFQAKERELQLQQAWAESYATKRQTQSKYGF